MRLELDAADLKPEHQTKDDRGGIRRNCHTKDVTFDKLNEQAQCAVRAVGKAVFYARDRRTQNTIYPPKKQ